MEYYNIFNQVEYYSQFAKEVFDYYNGKINGLNRALYISIDTTISNDNVYGRCIQYSGIVVLYIAELLKDFIDDNPKLKIIDTIIHELYHMDQLIYLDEFSTNPEYVKRIESDVRAITALYIMNNLMEIKSRFGVNIDARFLHRYNLNRDMNNYIRQDIYWFYADSINKLTDNHLSNITNILYDNDKVVLYINNESFIIKDSGIFNLDTYSYNNLIYKYAWAYSIYNANIKINEDLTNRSTDIVLTISNQLIYPIK